MSRVIKFRLRVEDKVFGYEKWYEGKWSEDRGHWLARPCWLYSKDGEYWNPEYIYHSAKDAFTGLLDKNGCEIYEGDLMLTDDMYHDYEDDVAINALPDGKIVSVDFKDGAFFAGTELLCEFATTWEIIGNIYENPNLLTP